MNKSTDIRVLEVKIEFEEHPFRTPLKFGGRVMDKHKLINVEVVVETRDGKVATGLGSMPIGNVWAWPSEKVSPEQAEKAMTDFAERVVDLFAVFPEYGHPIDMIYHISAEYYHIAKIVAREHKLEESLPELAQLVATSALDAAIHDAYGRANQLNSYNTLSKEFMNFDLSEYLDKQFAKEYLDKYTLRKPQERLPLYHLIGALDPLADVDIAKRLDDKLPETLPEWIHADGLTHFKIKLNGDNLAWDVARVVDIEKVVAETQKERGCHQWFYSTDFNEKCANVEYVLEFLKKVKEKTPAAYDRIQYIEQPTHRDLGAHPENKMHAAAKLKPVVIDESLTNYDSLLLARELGYSGVALKSCKGQTEALFAAAAAQKFGMFICVQDLTCPGLSFLQSASLAAHIPGVAAIEGNARQYCPNASTKFARLFPTMFDITDGTVGTAILDDIGLGF